MQKKIDDAAIMYNKTKDPKYKTLWYKLIKEHVNGKISYLPVMTSRKEGNLFVKEWLE